jgi:hypothetical protein
MRFLGFLISWTSLEMAQNNIFRPNYHIFRFNFWTFPTGWTLIDDFRTLDWFKFYNNSSVILDQIQCFCQQTF